MAGSVWADPSKNKAAALNNAAEAARAAGASAEAVAALTKEAGEAKKEAADSRPLGARLDNQRATVRRLEAKAATAEETLRAAQQRLDELKKDLATARRTP